MSPSLKDKLRMMDKELPTASRNGPPVAAKQEEDGEFHYVRESCSLASFCDRRFANPQNLSAIFGLPFPKTLQERDLLFLDTETTGLSGGAGTVAFQIGLGYIQGQSFVTEQFLIRDYHEEPAMLREIAGRLSRFSALVTFNGKTFDVPLIKSRLLMNRQSPECVTDLHADVLHPARRLWKLRLGNCRLSHLEEALLGVERQDDLAGALVPQTYFQYLKDRNFQPLERILEHNRQDIVSLAQLFFFLCMQWAKPEAIQSEMDLFSLARAHERRGETAQAVKCYRLSARGTETRGRAFQALAVHEKRNARADNAIRLYEAMAKRGEDPAMAYEALAKLAEHQKKDLSQALHYTRQGLLFLAEPTLCVNEAVQSRRIALQYRYARLLRKQGT